MANDILFIFCCFFLTHCCSAAFKDDICKFVQKTLLRGDPPQKISSQNQEQGESGINSYFFPDIIFWDPLQRIPSFRGIARCPKQGCIGKESFLRPVGWKDGKNERDCPRTLYGMTAPVILVSRIYRCSINHHEVIGHDSEIIVQLQGFERAPFLLSHASGITRELMGSISSFVISGMKFWEMENIFNQQLMTFLAERCKLLSLHHHNSNKYDPYALSKDIKSIWKGPSDSLIGDFFIADFMEKEKLYNAKMSQIMTNGWISMDHTFKVASNIGILRKSDKKWEKLFDSLFCILNDKGQVMAWQLTKGTSFNNVRGLVEGVKLRCEQNGINLKECYIDNCCTWRKKIQSVVNGCDVKLDLFHAISRVVSQIPTKHPFCSVCSKDFSKVFRRVDDLGPTREKATPTSEEMLKSIGEFQKKWKDVKYEDKPVLSVKAFEEITKLKVHISKGCTADIPPGCGSERNENLHKWLKNAIHRNRMSVVMALALFSTYFYVWNEKRASDKNSVIPPIDYLANELANKMTNETFGLAKADHVECSLPSVITLTIDKTSHLLDYDTGLIDEANYDNENEGTSKQKLIEEAITLYFHHKELKEKGLLSVFNPRFLHLMHKQALFAFSSSNCAKTKIDVNAVKLSSVISGFGFDILNVPKDGDCLFTSVLIQLQQMIPNLEENVVEHLLNLKLCGSTKSLPEQVLTLRSAMVKEWLEHKEDYQKFLVDIDLEEMAQQYRELGTFSGQLGNMMLLGICNVIRMTIIVFTSMEHFPIIPVSPHSRPLSIMPVYLAFNHAGPGHYDAVNYVETKKTPSNEFETQHMQQIDNSATSKRCRCGKGGAKKHKEDGSLKPFCVQIPGERLTACPCFQERQPCGKGCNCFNCGNYYGKRKLNVQEPNNSTQDRKRVRGAHFIQKNKVTNVDLLTSKNFEVTNTTWSDFETILFEVVFDYHCGSFNEEDAGGFVNLLKSSFNSICDWLNDNEPLLKLPVNHKSGKQVEGKLKFIMNQTTLFREVYLKQVELNLEM